MSILGNSINISNILSESQAIFFAKCIGSANVVRNNKIKEFNNFELDDNQAYSHIKKYEGLEFLKEVPVQVLRNASSMAFQDLQAYEKGLRGKPKIKPKHKKRSAIFTKELFSLQSLNKGKTLLTIFSHGGRGKRPIFSISLPHKHNEIGGQFRISRTGRKFYLSYSFDDGVKRPSNEQILKELSHLENEELKPMIMGIDRGVKRNVQCSDGQFFTYSLKEQNELKKINEKKKKHQRYLARKKRINNNSSKKCESNKQRKLQAKISKCDNKMTHIKTNACHHWSKEVATSADKVVAFEKLKIKNMTKRAKPKKDENGRKYIKNNANAKSGLNRALLNANMGKFGDFTKYKLNLLGKAWVEVNPVNSSKEHYLCGTTNTSRPDQATLICHTCDMVENADESASKTIQNRGVLHIKEEKFLTRKPRKFISRRKTVEVDITSRKKSDSVIVADRSVSVCSIINSVHRNKTSYIEAHNKKEHCLEQE